VTRRSIPSLVLTCLLAVGGVRAGESWEQKGDAAWNRRAVGFAATGVVSAEAIGTAVDCYERAFEAAPQSLALRFKLMKALYFQGHFVIEPRKSAKQIFTRVAELGEGGVNQLLEAAGGAIELRKKKPRERARLLAGTPHAAEAHFWAAIGWGLWGMSHSHAASGFKGVAGKIRDYAEIVQQIDPGFADAGGLRLLGRLHTATPKVPLFSGWIDRAEGLRLLERANAISTADPRNPLFLAEAILEQEPAQRARAITILRELCARAPDPDRLVEQSEMIASARALLDKVGGQPLAVGDDKP
jgi:hypothetical protein